VREKKGQREEGTKRRGGVASTKQVVVSILTLWMIVNFEIRDESKVFYI